ncbi:MAG: response regulator transcription factor [Eggerthellales bacterium]|nr:response regulator transcription factor [Eggerthellales bacterium]
MHDEASKPFSFAPAAAASPQAFAPAAAASPQARPSIQATSQEVRVCIADDQDLVRRGFRLILSSFPGISVVGEAVDGQDAVELAGRLDPDVMLMDIRMPRMDGIQATRQICDPKSGCHTRVLILTTFDADEYVYDALSAGASGFLLKDCEPEDLERAIRVIIRGDALIAPSITRRLVETFSRSRAQSCTWDPAKGALSSLTERELEIITMVGKGMTNDDIAAHLVISAATVRTHVGRIMSKLDVHERAQLVVVAYESGLVRPGE